MILFRALHKKYAKTWTDYKKGSSYKVGARWNVASTPVMYFSSNVQNAMLELGSYVKSPKIANKLFAIGVFECPTLKLKEIQPEELPTNWQQYPFNIATQKYGTEILNDEKYDGLIAPSATINPELAASMQNELRNCIYANVIVNPERDALKRMTLLESFEPIYSNRMFT